MRTGRPKQPLILTEEERERLQSLAHRARSQAVLARRAHVVLACAEGLENQVVAKITALLQGHGWQMALAVFGSASRGLVRRTTARGSAPGDRCAGAAGRNTDLGKGAARANALVYAGVSQSHRTQPDDHQPHLACFRVAAAPQ